MFWLITKEQERSENLQKKKKNKHTKKVFIALRWNVIQYEEVHVYCIQSNLNEQFSCWRPLFCCAWSEVSGSRLWLSSLVYTPSSLSNSWHCLSEKYLCGRAPSTWLMFIARDNAAVQYQSSEMTSMSSGLPCCVATLQRLTCWLPFLFCCESGDSSSSFCLLCLVLLFWNQTFTWTRTRKRACFNISAIYY